MRTASGSPWQMTIDIPEVLQFAAYMGQRESFSTLEGLSPASQTEAEWRQWWEARIAQLTQGPAGLVIDPPDFPSLAGKPQLRNLCQRYWKEFNQDWSQGKMPLVRRLQAQLQALHLQDIVGDCERSTGRRAAFNLRLDFVRWPEQYQRTVSESHIILGTAYLDSARLNDLQALVRDAVDKLV